MYPLIGLLAGFLAGMFGIGGGIVVVPLLILVLGGQGVEGEFAVHLAVGTSLATIAVTSISSARAHFLNGNVRSDCLLAMLPGIIMGACGGVILGASLSGRSLSLLLGLFFVLLAMKLLVGLEPRKDRTLPNRWGMSAAGGVIGASSALFGVGGGVLTVPFLEWRSVAMHQAIGTASAVGVPIALVGAATAMFVGETSPLEWTTGYVYWPAFLGIIILSVPGARLGAKVASRLPARILKSVFAVLLLIVGIKFLFG